jgi:hypothetical protein
MFRNDEHRAMYDSDLGIESNTVDVCCSLWNHDYHSLSDSGGRLAHANDAVRTALDADLSVVGTRWV